MHMVTMVDRQVGEIVDLRELDLAKFVFSVVTMAVMTISNRTSTRGLHGANVHPETGEQFRGEEHCEGDCESPLWPTGREDEGTC